MDAGALKNNEFQDLLSHIAATENINIIVSVDLIKSGMLWSE
jgi:hypothetical protein